MNGLEEKVVLVTGAAGGLGKATAELLSAHGARVALIDANDALLLETTTALQRQDRAVMSMTGDITIPAVLDQFVEAALTSFGGIDAVCNIAGILGAGTLEEASTARFDQVMHVNCLAQMLLIQRALPALKASRAPSIVNVASVGALTALPFMSLYCASKAAVLGLTRALATELAPHIRCNAVCPGGIDSPMSRGLLAQFSPQEQLELIPKLTGRQLLKRFARPEEIAALIGFLVSDDSSFMTGAILPIDGGHTTW